MKLTSRMALIAVAALAVAGCGASSTGGTGGGSGGGAGGGSGGGTGSKFCSSDSECTSTQICHPTAKVCVKTCTAGSDCPSGAKTCDFPAFATTGSKVCNCSTDQLCAADTTGTVCSAYDSICGAKCATSSDCPGNRSCNSATGQCGPPIVDTDAGMDAGTTDAGTACGLGTCTGGKICGFLSSPPACETPKTCSATTPPQPDSCGYGQVCNAGTCAEIVPGSCANFTAGSNPLAWDPAQLTSNGPVIFGLSKVSFGTDATFCGATNTVRAKIHVRAYSEMAVLVSETNQPALHYVRTDHTELPLTATSIQNYASDGGARQADFDVNLCAPTGTASLTVGLYYTNGNAACFTAN